MSFVAVVFTSVVVSAIIITVGGGIVVIIVGYGIVIMIVVLVIVVVVDGGGGGGAIGDRGGCGHFHHHFQCANGRNLITVTINRVAASCHQPIYRLR